MIDLSGFPAPDNAPEPGTCVRIERPENGLAILVLDPPHRKMPVFDSPLLSDLDAALDTIEADASIKGVVITGRDPLTFAAGADIDGIKSLTDAKVVEDIVLAVHSIFNRIENLKAFTVAAVGGPVPGGAYEISLACDRIVLADDPKSRIGLPETQLGILPGWGGTHRLPERVGLPLALDAILTGKLYPAKPAWKKGIVDRIAKPDYLVEVAIEIAMKRMKCVRKTRGWKSYLIDRNPLVQRLIVSQARKAVLSKTKGHYPAPIRALEMAATAVGRSRKRAATLEARAIGELATSSICKSLIGIFHASEAAKKLSKSKDGFTPRTFQYAGVVGAGIMGGGIASLLASKGVLTRMADLDPQAVADALSIHRKSVQKKVKRRKMTRAKGMQSIDNLDGVTNTDAFGRSEIVIEAVAEVMKVKKLVLGGLAEQMDENAILATNTSSLSVTEIAAGLPNPERVVGMHFFNPVKAMPLVEVIRGEQTSEEAALEVAALAVRLGKTPVIVKDVAGFLVNRLLAPYIDEAARLFSEGAKPAKLEKLMTKFGMPMGPLRLLDEVGLDIGSHVSVSLHEAYGARMIPGEGVKSIMNDDRLGHKTNKGFYNYPTERKAKPTLCDDLPSFQQGKSAASLSDEQLVDRMVLTMVNEAALCLEEEVVSSAEALDLATVFGTGFAPFRGGLMHYADSLGIPEVVRRLQAIADADDIQKREGGVDKFTPAPLLVRMAENGEKFFS